VDVNNGNLPFLHTPRGYPTNMSSARALYSLKSRKRGSHRQSCRSGWRSAATASAAGNSVRRDSASDTTLGRSVGDARRCVLVASDLPAGRSVREYRRRSLAVATPHGSAFPHTLYPRSIAVDASGDGPVRFEARGSRRAEQKRGSSRRLVRERASPPTEAPAPHKRGGAWWSARLGCVPMPPDAGPLSPPLRVRNGFPLPARNRSPRRPTEGSLHPPFLASALASVRRIADGSGRVRMSFNNGSVERPFAPIQVPFGIGFGLKALKKTLPRPIPFPAQQPVVDRGRRPVAFGQVFPRRAGALDPENAVEHLTMIPPRTSPSGRFRRQVLLQSLILSVC
jgi:hypothetical protein